MLTLLPRVASAAAEDCLTEPTSDKPDGQQWRYRIDRNSNRRCWYLKDTTGNAKDAAKDTAPRQPASSQPTSAWDFGQSTPPKLAPRRGDDTAKAQLGTGTTSVVHTRPAAVSFGDNLRRDMPSAPWQPPQSQLLDSADIDTPSSAASLTTADDPPTEVNPAAAPMSAEAAGSAKLVKPTAPIHKLLMVVIGALSLSGLLASAQYRLSKAGRARRRKHNWQRAIVRARRNRDKPRNKKTVHAGTRAGRAAKPLAVAAATAAPAVRIKPPPAIAVAVELPPAIVVPPAKIPDPAVELAELMAARSKTSTGKPAPAAKAAPQPAVAPVVPHPIEPVRAVEVPAAPEIADPAAELVDLLGAHAAKKAGQQPKQISRPAAKAAPAPQPPAEAAPPQLSRIEDPEAELADLLQSRFAPPAPPVRQPADRPKDRAKDRPTPKPQVAQVAPAARKIVDPITELADLLEAKESKRAARLANAAAPRQENTSPVMPIAQPVAHPVDPAAELFGMLEAHAAQPVPAPRPVRAPQPVEGIRPAQAPRPAKPQQPVEAALPIQTAQQPARLATPRRKKLSPAPVPEVTRADIAPAKAVARPPAHAESIEHAAAPKPGKPAGKAPRRKSADMPPLPPALMETPNNDGPTPPLDFIPRPHALRPRMQDIRQDESLDGVQDILARLARRG
ncbi:MAG: hypothetical protein V7634_988 [Bradyrhizobium sp.]